jgi:hypothetical protein
MHGFRHTLTSTSVVLPREEDTPASSEGKLNRRFLILFPVPKFEEQFFQAGNRGLGVGSACF